MPRTQLLHPLMAVALAAALLAGCTTSQQSTTDQGIPSEDQIRAAEAGFIPSDHDPSTALPQREGPTTTDTAGTRLPSEGDLTTSSEMAQGFRVQAYSTVDIDRARMKKADLEAMFPGEWFYLEYASPSYRIRAGNFLTRLDAERFARLMNEQGFLEAWVVPERVYKNIARRPAAEPPPPAEQVEPK